MSYSIFFKAIKIKFIETAIDTLLNNVYKNCIKTQNNISINNIKVGMCFKEIRGSIGINYQQCKITEIGKMSHDITRIVFDFKNARMFGLSGTLIENAFDIIYINTNYHDVTWRFII